MRAQMNLLGPEVIERSEFRAAFVKSVLYV